MGSQWTGKTQEGDDATSCVQRSAKEGIGEKVSDTEIHKQTGQKKAGRETGAQGQSSEYLFR